MISDGMPEKTWRCSLFQYALHQGTQACVALLTSGQGLRDEPGCFRLMMNFLSDLAQKQLRRIGDEDAIAETR